MRQTAFVTALLSLSCYPQGGWPPTRARRREKSYLVRRIRTEMAFKDRSKVVTTIDYDPAVEPKVGPAEMDFRPPKKPGGQP